MRYPNHPSMPGTKLFLLLFVSVLCGNNAAHAQKNATASRPANISVFGGFSYTNPDYGPQKNSGLTLGADYTRYFGWHIDPSIEIRANRTTGDTINEESIRAGLRLQTGYHRFHPYVMGSVGATQISFKSPPNPGAPHYTQDQAFSTAVGGGIDVDVVRNFQAKFDYQREFMNFGPNATRPENADFTLTPGVYTFGVVYNFSFFSHTR